MMYQGELAAILTAVCWSFNSVVFSKAGNRVGSKTVNHIRLWIATLALSIIHLVFYGSLFPIPIEDWRLFYLALSGIIGLIIGDGLLFESFVLIGPRLSMLLMLLTPIFGSIMAWIAIGEKLQLIEIAGIFITVVGIGWVISERKDHSKGDSKKFAMGILLGAGGAAGQAGGLLFSKMGMAGDYSAVSASLVRISASALILGAMFLVRGLMPSELKKMKDKKAFLEILSGSLVGPVLGIVLSLVAIAHTHIGVASTLMSMAPIILIPVSKIFFKEKITVQAITGTLVATAGAAMLFFL
jgi:drug/metabolite transporter (DMT)-like permease